MTGRAAIDFGYTYAPDGDVTRQWDGSERSSLPGGVDEVLYDEHPYRDLLTRWRAYLPWTGASATDVTVTQVDELGRWRRAQSESSSPSRTVEVSFDYDASFPERLVRVRRLGGGPQPSRSTVASLGYDELGQVTSLAYGLPVRAQTLAYGPRGNVEVSTNASGVSEHLYSDTMERWRRNGPVRGLSERFRYGVGGELLEDEQVRRAQRPRGAPLLRGRRVRDEFVYLGGRKIAAIHSGDGVRRASPPELTLLFADRLGTVRQVTTTDLRAVARIDTDAWGNGSVHDERGAAGPVRIPNIGERLPGQYADGGEPFAPVANGWRFYAPTLGAYLSPDPLYRASGMAPGAQAYAYAGGRPLVAFDPTGRYARVCCTDPGKIEIDVPIRFTFSPTGQTGAYEQTLRNIIALVWSGRFGAFDVATRSESWGGNVITVDGGSYSPGAVVSHVTGGNTGTWYAAQIAAMNATPAHEAGHLMGLGDLYESFGNNFGQTMPLFQGNVMGLNGVDVDEWQIEQILRNAGLWNGTKARCGCGTIGSPRE